MERIFSSKMLTNFYQTARHNFLQDGKLLRTFYYENDKRLLIWNQEFHHRDHKSRQLVLFWSSKVYGRFS